MKKPYILLVVLTLTSCASIFTNRTLKRTGVFDTKCELNIIKKEKQEIIFIDMHHVGREEFYNDVANKVDSLQKLGYSVFYEQVSNNKSTDSLTTVRNFMKLRKLLGYIPNKHLDTTTNIISGKLKYRGKYKLINQPSYKKMNVDSLTSLKADVSISELISEFEKNITEIKLSACDLKFNLKDKNYNCKKIKKSLRKKFRKEYVIDYRNSYLAKKIAESKKNKILVIYGKAHFFGVHMKLNTLDKSYKLIKYKNIINKTHN